MKKARGSALIIAMLMIASIGSIAFGIARLVFLESNITALHENSVQSYYAAESGIEEGFLRYRYNRNAEVPFENWSTASTKYFRTNLAAMTVETGSGFEGLSIIPATDPFEADEQSYDLRMGYLDNSYWSTYYADETSNNNWSLDQIKSTDFGTGEYSYLKIGKDENYKFDLSNYNFLDNNFRLGLKFLDLGAGTAPLLPTEYCKAVAEIKLVTEDDYGNKVEYKALTSPFPEDCKAVLDLGGSYAFAGSPSERATSTDQKSYYYRSDGFVETMITNAGDIIQPHYQKAELQIKPLFTDAVAIFGATACTISVSPCTTRSMLMPGPYTSMVSVGYYGGVTKTLTANIDRQSGTLYDLFDYVIYNNGG